MNYKRGITPVIVFLIVTAFAVLGAVGYSAFKTDVTKDEAVDESVFNVDTSDWKTYRNEKYGFEVKYPVDFANVSDLTTAQQNSLGSYMAVCLVGGEQNARIDSTKEQNSFCYIGEQKSDGFVVASLNITADSSENMQACQKIKNTYNDQMTKKINKNGLTFFEDKADDAALGHYVSGNSYRTYHEGVCYTIDLSVESNRGVLEKGLSFDFSAMMRGKLNSIFSTFKFIPQKQNDEVSNWKTYRNEKYGFELRYPSKYKIENYSKDSDVYFVDSEGKRIYLEVESKDGTFCIWGLCQKEKIGSISKNGIIWEDLGLNKYCDVGQCSGNQRVYRIVHLDNRFNIISGLTDKQTEEEFLSNFKFIDKNPTSEKPVLNSKPCFVGGCSSQLCGEKEDEMVSTCEWKDEYACYRKTKCERQSSGQCGWTETSEFKSCLANPPK